jgi:hypothetical protein
MSSSQTEAVERLIAATNRTNLVALDKTLAAISYAPGNYAAAASRVSNISERIVRAVHEMGMLLPPNLRAIQGAAL